MPQQVLYLRGPTLPDYEHDQPSTEEQEHFINALLTSQVHLASTVCLDSPFSSILQKRLVVLQRIFAAVSYKYHDMENVQKQQQEESRAEEAKNNAEKTFTGNDALIEVGVRTGLSLLFSLLRQNWQLSSSLGCSGICNDVLQTAADAIKALPPLSLSNENKLLSLGLHTLNQVTHFLRAATMPNSGADIRGKAKCITIVYCGLAVFL